MQSPSQKKDTSSVGKNSTKTALESWLGDELCHWAASLEVAIDGDHPFAFSAQGFVQDRPHFETNELVKMMFFNSEGSKGFCQLELLVWLTVLGFLFRWMFVSTCLVFFGWKLMFFTLTGTWLVNMVSASSLASRFWGTPPPVLLVPEAWLVEVFFLWLLKDPFGWF